VLVSLFPAVKVVGPEKANDLQVEYITIDLVLAAGGYMVCPHDGDASIVQLIPANILLGLDKGWNALG